MSAPTPRQIDEKAEQYYRLKDALDEATEAAKLACIPLAELKAQLVDLIRHFGSPTPKNPGCSMGLRQRWLSRLAAPFRLMARPSKDFAIRNGMSSMLHLQTCPAG